MASTDPGNVTHAVGGGETGEVPGDAPAGGNPPLDDGEQDDGPDDAPAELADEAAEDDPR